MTKSKRNIRKPKRGRPRSTGSGTPLLVRMHEPRLSQIDDWIRDSGLSRPEAVRQLVGWALDRSRELRQQQQT